MNCCSIIWFRLKRQEPVFIKENILVEKTRSKELSPKGYLATKAIFQVKQSVLTDHFINHSINYDMFVPVYGANYFCKRNQHQVFDGGGIFKRKDHFSVTTIFQSFFFS